MLMELNYKGYCLLGDSGYNVETFLMTPLNNPVTRAENLYNESQIRTRNVVERSYGVWKKRFPCLSKGLAVKVERILHIIVATAILHNIAISQNDPVPDEEEINLDIHNDDEVIINGNENGNDNGNNVRTDLINNYFGIF